MFTLEKNTFALWFSTNTRHNHLIGQGKAPRHYPHAAQINLPSELFDTIDIHLKDTDFTKTYVYNELRKRSHDVQGILTRLRPYLPIPYLSDLGLEPPILGIRFFEKPVFGQPTPLAWVTQQTFKLPDFLGAELEKCLQKNNTGPISITLEQMDTWGLDRLKIEQIKRCRPLLICTNGESSLWNQRVSYFEPYDMMSMKAQVSLLKWVARKTHEAYKYHEPANLIGLYSDLWIGETQTYKRTGITEKPLFFDPFEISVESKPLLK